MDAQLAARAFEQLDTPLPLGDRVRAAWYVGLHNIAEGVFNLMLRRGVDPRDFSLCAFGAAGPMLLPLLLDVAHVPSVIVPPYPGLFSALGLLSTDQGYSASRSRYIVLRPEAAHEIDTLLTEMEATLRQRVGAEQMVVERRFDGRLVGQSWTTPLVTLPAGPITPETIPTMIESFTTSTSSATGTGSPR